MKPKIVCSECNAELQWNDKFCAACGRPVEWPEVGPGVATAQRGGRATVRCRQCGAENPADAGVCQTCGAALEGKERTPRQSASTREHHPERNKTIPPVTGSWKLVAGFFVFLAAGISLLQFLSGSSQIPAKTRPQQTQQPAANLQSIPQIEELERQVKADPNDVALKLRMANLLHDNRFFDQAISYYKEYLAKRPKDANAKVDMGICYNELGNLPEAERQLKEVLKDDPKHLFALFNLGIVTLRSGDVGTANEWFRKVVAADPGSDVAKRAGEMLARHSLP